MNVAPVISSTEQLSAYVALLVALVAGAFSLLGLVVSKENKVSEFRNEWMNELRNDLADFVAHAFLIHSEIIEYSSGRIDDYTKHLDRIREPLVGLNRAATKIKLRLHQEARENAPLMRSMSALQDSLREPPSVLPSYYEQIGPLGKEVEIQGAISLSREWVRVRTGERGFRLAKTIAYVALCASIAAMLYLMKFAR